MSKKTFNVFINSADRISGTHNNATYDINWESMFPHNPHIANDEQNYSVSMTLTTSAGYYGNYGTTYHTGARVMAYFAAKNWSYDTSTYSRSHVLGHIIRDGSTAFLSSASADNPVRVMKRPTINQLTISIYNMNLNGNATNPLLLQTNAGNTAEDVDMTPYYMILSFTEV